MPSHDMDDRLEAQIRTPKVAGLAGLDRLVEPVRPLRSGMSEHSHSLPNFVAFLNVPCPGPFPEGAAFATTCGRGA